MRQLARRSLLRALASGVASAALLAGMLAGAGGAAAAVTGSAAAGQSAAAARAAAAAHLAAPGGAAAAAHAAAALSPAATTVTSCQVTYTVQSDWGTGFTVAITIENTGSAITSWTLGYSYAGNQALAQGWSGNWSQSGQAVTVTNASWNGSLAASASVQIGANFNYSGSNTAPDLVHAERDGLQRRQQRLAARHHRRRRPRPAAPRPSPSPSPSPSPTSTGGGGSGSGSGAPMVSITSPTAGEIFTPGSAITLQASPVSGSGHGHLGHLLPEHHRGQRHARSAWPPASPWAVQWANVPGGQLLDHRGGQQRQGEPDLLPGGDHRRVADRGGQPEPDRGPAGQLGHVRRGPVRPAVVQRHGVRGRAAAATPTCPSRPAPR